MMERGNAPLLGLARSLMEAENPGDFLRNLASTAREGIDADWAAVWTFRRRTREFTLELGVPRGLYSAAPAGAGGKGDPIAEAVTRGKLVAKRGGEIGSEVLVHLDPAERPPVAEIYCLPFTWDKERVGVLELIREKPSPQEEYPEKLRYLTAIGTLASAAASSIGRFQSRREKQLGVINRLTQLYDVSKVFHSTLEQETLLPAIAARIRLIFEVDVCRIWLPAEDGQSVLCRFPPEVEETFPSESGEGLPWNCVRRRETIWVADVAAAEEAVVTVAESDPPGSILCVPLLVEENCLGAIEIVRASDSPGFSEDDRDFLEEIAGQAAAALRNSNLFQAERKAEELGALLDVSREITSTLDLDRVLKTVVNRADDLVPAERCAVLLAEGRQIDLRAVSGQMEIDRKDPHIKALKEILTWVQLSGNGIYVSELEGEIEADREENKEKFRKYFKQSGMKTFVALPLRDEEGLLGMLSIESSQPYFVTQEQLEMFNILVNQATVAIRNAFLYHEIPLINIIQPIVGWKNRLKKVPLWKWVRNAGFAAAAAIFTFVPWNMNVGGQAVVLPAMSSVVAAEVAGVIRQVYFREGDEIRKGERIASLVEQDYLAAWEEARSRHDIANREVARYDAMLDLAGAGQARIRRDQTAEEMNLLRRQLEKTMITSPVNGVIITPRLEQKVGMFLAKGEEFCRVADMQEVAVEILVPEAEIQEIREGQKLRLKIDSFPLRIFFGEIEIVGERVTEKDRKRYLIARARIDGNGLPLKTGMLGRAKILVGHRSLGYFLFRRPVRGLYRMVWAMWP
ncbi:MAG: GAF domain-containing protein [Acidobacteria bacterium]|nr:GAF domain-containing protein [Acidobacteriota bacterium]